MKKEEQVEGVEKPLKKFSFRKTFWQLVLLALIGGGGYCVWKYPNMLQDVRDFVRANPQQEKQVAELQKEIGALRVELKAVKSALGQTAGNVQAEVDKTVESLNDKFVAMEKINTSIIDSKADVAMILGVITRMDKAEERLDGIAKVSDDSALILSATMLIKEKALRGMSFVFEAEVLQLLSESKVKIKDDVAIIAKDATDGVATDFELVNDFEEIYQGIIAGRETPQEPDTWQERVKKKFSEVVQVRKKGEAKTEVKDDLEMARQYVLSGNFYKAALILEADKSPTFAAWVAKANHRVDFDKAISHISMHSLALMQVNNLKGKK